MGKLRGSTCTRCFTDSEDDVCYVCHPDHIADATKKVQPTRCPHCGYTPGVIPSDFDAYAQANCEHREGHEKPAPAPRTPEDSNANGSAGVSGENPRTPAPLPSVERVDKLVAAIRGNYAVHVADELREYITDLTRSLAEAEAERDEYRACAVTQDYGRKDFICSMWTQVGKYERDRADLNATCAALAVAAKRDRELAEDAEASVRELEAQLKVTEDACERNFARAESAEARVRELEAQLSGVGVRQYREAVERLHKAEAFKARVMEWARGRCDFCGNISTQACQTCCHYAPGAAGTDNWTLPKRWEVWE